ncbi:type VI secretion system tube protein Hcp [Jiulongibacter sp. NS-SX5]|uniref:type VI secretion system tube protein Hcp n=1 Tax=Jiulongibacter sp. NS-SX5 TaxID=3463854 RepID=UPI004059F514
MKTKLFSSVLFLIPFLFPFEDVPQTEKPNTVNSLEYYLYSPKSDEIPGETLNGHFDDVDAIEFSQLSFSTSNNVYFGTQGGLGLSSGKASGNSLTFKTIASTAIPGLYQKLCSGDHFLDIIIAIGSSNTTGGSQNPENFKYQEKIELKLAVISNIAIEADSPSDGEVIYTVTLEYGAIKRTLYEYDNSGAVSDSQSVEWSYVLNNNSFDIE